MADRSAAAVAAVQETGRRTGKTGRKGAFELDFPESWTRRGRQILGNIPPIFPLFHKYQRVTAPSYSLIFSLARRFRFLILSVKLSTFAE